MVKHRDRQHKRNIHMCLQLHVNTSEKEARKGSRRKNCNCTYSDSICIYIPFSLMKRHLVEREETLVGNMETYMMCYNFKKF